MMRCSLYIHIPFCRSKCRYCDFYSIAGQGVLIDRYIDALAGEWELYRRRFEVEIATLFIGGGTPSVLTIPQWERLHQRLLMHLPLQPDAEWTVECNPESLNTGKANLLAGFGVNRISIGIQSLCERELVTLGRPHTASGAFQLLGNPSLARFASIGVDLMYGLPGQTPESLARTLDAVSGLPSVSHLSAYELTIAESTPFGRHRSILPLPGDDEIGAMTEVLYAKLPEQGFEQYEVSNFARTGHRCRHNCAYWDHIPYIGLGCAAHSYLPPQRRRNVDDVNEYCDRVTSGNFPLADEEPIDASTLAREMAFLRLRTSDGLNEETFREKTGMEFRRWAGEVRLQRFTDEQLLSYQPPWWRPSRRGMLCADYIARELF